MLKNLIIKGNEIKEPGLFGKTVYVIKGNEIKEPGIFGKTVYVIKGNEIKEPGTFGRTVYVIKGNEIKEPGLFGRTVGKVDDNKIKPKNVVYSIKTESKHDNKKSYTETLSKTNNNERKNAVSSNTKMTNIAETKKSESIKNETEQQNASNNSNTTFSTEQLLFILENASMEYILQHFVIFRQYAFLAKDTVINSIKGLRKYKFEGNYELDLSPINKLVDYIFKYDGAMNKQDLNMDKAERRKNIVEGFNIKKDVINAILDESDYWSDLNKHDISTKLFALIEENNRY